MFSKTQLLALLASTAAAAPTTTTTEQAKPFGLIATHSGNSAVHLRSINAAQGQFWIGRATQSYCPPQAGSCPPGSSTGFVAAPAGNTLSLNVEVPGGQQVYVDGESGVLAFSQAHGAPPAGALLTGFSWTPPSEPGRVGSLTAPGSIVACPTGEQDVFAVKVEVGEAKFPDCIGIGAVGSEGPEGPSAWQYA